MRRGSSFSLEIEEKPWIEFSLVLNSLEFSRLSSNWVVGLMLMTRGASSCCITKPPHAKGFSIPFLTSCANKGYSTKWLLILRPAPVALIIYWACSLYINKLFPNN